MNKELTQQFLFISVNMALTHKCNEQCTRFRPRQYTHCNDYLKTGSLCDRTNSRYSREKISLQWYSPSPPLWGKQQCGKKMHYIYLILQEMKLKKY